MKIISRMKFTIPLLLAFWVMVLPAKAQQEIKIGDPWWVNTAAVTYLLEKIIDFLGVVASGVTVERYVNNTPRILLEMSEGSVDIHPNIQMPESQELIESYRGFGGVAIELGRRLYEIERGVCVSASSLNDHDNYSIRQLPSVVNQYSISKIWVGEPWLESAYINEKILKQYDLGHLSIYAPNDVLRANIQSSLENNEPYAFFCQKPDTFWVDSQYQNQPITILDIPVDDRPKSSAHIAYSSRLNERHPELVSLIQNLSVSEDKMSRFMRAIIDINSNNDSSREQGEQVFNRWIEENADNLRNRIGR